MDLYSTDIDKYTDTVIHSEAPDLKIPPEACLVDREVAPCCIVIFGASGDLTMRKLAPSLYSLFLSGGMPGSFVIVGVSRHEMSHERFREKVKNAVSGQDQSKWDDFAQRLFYRQVRFDSADSFAALSKALEDLDGQFHFHGNKIFYFAIPPSLYKSTSVMLGEAGLSRENEKGNGWSRVVVEKPFGRDLESARDLNRSIEKFFREDQVFRIDHYLAKETVQNVLVFRFANAIFEPLWNNMFIDHVHITAAESLGVENRADYYEEAGVLRDMFQNHMLQLLALTTMEPPSRFVADLVRDETCKVFRSLRQLNSAEGRGNIVLGQYGPGIIDGRTVRGYREEPGVDPQSLTPTFAMMKVFVENWRWEGVPFYLTSGKRLHSKVTEMVIDFKKVPHSMFRDVLGQTITPNRLTLGVFPDETINLTFQTKNPGARFRLRGVTMNFNYTDNYGGPVVDAYQKALLDCMLGDQTLFWRQDAVELCWAFIDSLMGECEDCEDRFQRLHLYEAGSWGPETALEWRK